LAVSVHGELPVSAMIVMLSFRVLCFALLTNVKWQISVIADGSCCVRFSVTSGLGWLASGLCTQFQPAQGMAHRSMVTVYIWQRRVGHFNFWLSLSLSDWAKP